MSVLSSNGKAGFTGSPGESLCNNCHSSYTLNSGGGSIAISSSPAFVNNTYVPSTTYTMSATVSRTGNNLFGIGFEALTPTNTNAGTLAISNSAETKTASVTILGTSRKNVIHQLNGGASANSKTFNFNWTAPTSGAVTFYAAGVAANGNGSDVGDYVYNTSLALTAPTVGIQENNVNLHALKVFPNPVVDQLNIQYELQEAADISIELFSIHAEKIAQLLKEKQSVGMKNVNLLLPGDLKSGCYILRIFVNGNVINKNIIIQ